MKNILSILIANTVCVGGALAAGMPDFYASGIVGHNIGAFQHTILQTAVNGFDKTVHTQITKPAGVQQTQKDVRLYGQMPMYGEYGDDGSVLGHSGGDGYNNNVWVSWNYADDDVKFDDVEKLDTRSNVVMAGGASDVGRFGQFGVFVGYVGSKQSNSGIDISENGGFFGFYNGYQFGKLKVNAILDGGALSSDLGRDEFSNMWLGGGLNVSYDFVVDNTFTIQPVVYGVYSWVKMPNYISESGNSINTTNLSLFEVAPGVRFVKNVVDDWYGVASVKFVGMFDNRPGFKVNNVKLDDLTIGNYTEYGIGLEKNIYDLNISININRRDGAYTGWNGGVNIKYLF